MLAAGSVVTMTVVMLTVVMLAAGSSRAEPRTWPERPITMVVPLTAGSGTDIIARIVAKNLGVRYGQPRVIENRAGADAAVVARISDALRGMLKSDDVKTPCAAQGVEAAASTGAKLREIVRREREDYRVVALRAGVRPH
jgi:tripartite-type tricarboxylate transporter receptor subunit TctC